TALDRRGVDSGPLEGLPRGFQQQPLLRIHRDRLARRDAEERRVEVGHVVEETAGAGVAVASAVRVGVEQGAVRPAPVGGEGADRVATRRDQLPQVFRRPHATGKPARHTDDRDRFLELGLGRLELLADLAQVGGDQLQVLAELVFGTRHTALPPSQGTSDRQVGQVRPSSLSVSANMSSSVGSSGPVSAGPSAWPLPAPSICHSKARSRLPSRVLAPWSSDDAATTDSNRSSSPKTDAVAGVPSVPISVRMCRASAAGDGWSKMAVAGSRSPHVEPNRLRSSTAVSESNPSSRKPVSDLT